MDRFERDDLEREIAQELSSRLQRLRRFVLWPMLLLSASTAPPTYIALRELQWQAQWDAGAETAHHLPLVTGALSLLPVLIAFGVVIFVYRRVQSHRLQRWKRELSERYGVPESDLDLGYIFH